MVKVSQPLFYRNGVNSYALGWERFDSCCTRLNIHLRGALKASHNPLYIADLRLQPGTSLDFDKFGGPVVALTPDTSSTEPSIDFISSIVQSGGQGTRGMNWISSGKLSCPQFLRV